jgi:predicted transcriptional regulator
LGDQFEQLPLDRRERMALMLVDGQRTIADLARLTRRQEQELYTVLAHLEALGLIVIRGW